MYLLVGLGNPGPKYEANRHNVGFMVIDELSRRLAADTPLEKFSGLFARARLGDQEVVLLKPQTYMNLSGSSVHMAMTFFKVELSRVLVIHDELDLDFGTLKLKQAGGTAVVPGRASGLLQLERAEV